MIETAQQTINGDEVDVVTITNARWRAVLTNAGARLLELHVPDDHGNTVDVALQRPSLAEAAVDDNYFGSTAGRYANRIRHGQFELDGRQVHLSSNEGANHLHGGKQGFDRHIWHTVVAPDGEDDTVRFTRTSPDGEEGYPGALDVEITYRLRPPSLSIDITATTDQPTLANIVNHTYINVAGHDSGTVLDHVLQINGTFFVPVDDELLATGEIRTVDQTPFDFRTPTPIGARIADVPNGAAGRQVESPGYDHNWVLDGSGMRQALEVHDPHTGRRMRLFTNQPGVQVYTGGYLDGVSAKDPVGHYPAFAGFTMETQTFPGSPNHPHFPSARLNPGEHYHNAVRLEFPVIGEESSSVTPGALS